ncbi:MAG: hypothetical protein Q9202_003770 [Teloschistes flavicans]
MPVSEACGDSGFDAPQSLNAKRKSSILNLFSASNAYSGKSRVIAASRAASLSTPSASQTVGSEIVSREQPPTTEPDSPGSPMGVISGDVDGLISQLGQTKIETAAPSASRIVEVGNGFPLGMAFDVSKFYDIRSDFRRLDKRKRDLGILPKMAGRQKHGFRPEELLWYDAIDLKDCQGSDLDNEIHPLLHRDSFDDTPDHVYDQLIPGLRLATRFLSHPSCMQFWVTLAKGERRVDHEMSRRCGDTRHRISRNAPMTKKNVTEVIEYMKDLGMAKAFHFTFANGLVFQGGAAFGTANMVCDYRSEHNENQQSSQQSSQQSGSVQRCNIRLHSDFYVVAKKLSTLHYPDPAQKLRFNLIVATLIVHELAHAIELSQWRNRAPSPYEPFLLHHNEAELGRMWETYIFGGQVTPINDRVDGLYGISTWKWPRSFGEMDPERTICYALPMTFIQRLQKTATWEQKTDLGDTKAFWAPRDGATSIYMNSVTTVSWTEEERVAKEILNEQRTLETEEPARKRREVADGHAVGIKDLATELEVIEQQIPEVETGTNAQHVYRVKLEPRSVLSKKQRRQQKKKLGRKQRPSTEEVEQAQSPVMMEEPPPPIIDIIPQLDSPAVLNDTSPDEAPLVETKVEADAIVVQDGDTTTPMHDTQEISLEHTE